MVCVTIADTTNSYNLLSDLKYFPFLGNFLLTFMYWDDKINVEVI